MAHLQIDILAECVPGDITLRSRVDNLVHIHSLRLRLRLRPSTHIVLQGLVD
jgi:hypothetical protein